jgi:hypothetical protein
MRLALAATLTISVSDGTNTNAMSSTASSGACHAPGPTSPLAARVHVGTCATCH